MLKLGDKVSCLEEGIDEAIVGGIFIPEDTDETQVLLVFQKMFSNTISGHNGFWIKPYAKDKKYSYLDKDFSKEQYSSYWVRPQECKILRTQFEFVF